MNKKMNKGKWLKRFIYAGGILVSLMLLFSIAAHFATPWINQYRPQIEQYASKQLGMQVEIGNMRVGWYYFEPVVHLYDVRVISPAISVPVVAMDDVAVGIDVLPSLWHQNLLPGVLVLSRATVNLDPALFTGEPIDLKKLLGWILARKKIMLQDITIQGMFPDQPEFYLSQGFLTLQKKSDVYRAEAQFDYQNKVSGMNSNTLPMHVAMTVDIKNTIKNLASRDGWQGDFDVSLDNVNLPDWQARLASYLPAVGSIISGEGNFQGKGHFHQGNITDWDVTWSVHDLEIPPNPPLKRGGEVGPPLKRGGEGTVDIFDSELVSGNMNWAPDQGSLVLHLQNAHVNYSAIFSTIVPLTSFDWHVDWQKKEDVWQIQTERLFLKNDQISLESMGSLVWPTNTIQWTAKFGLTDLAAVKQYMPDGIINDKLEAWLHRSVIGADSVEGTLLLRGKLVDFPFDKVPNDQGLFLVDSDWKNFTLDFKPGWPAAKNMDAHITFKNRDLMGDITSGTLDKLPLNGVKATIPDMGLQQEVLVIHADLNTDAANARSFIINSPLKDKLKAMQSMLLTGNADFQVDVQIPLYKGNDTNLVHGLVNFPDNDFILPDWWNLHFQHLKGTLEFSQSGIIDGQLSAGLFQYPVTMSMKTNANAATEVDVNGILGMDAVQKLFPVFILERLKGKTPYTAKLILTPSPDDQDTLTLNTNLNGVTVDLPSPYAKKASENKPLSLALAFSEKQNTDLAIDYAKLFNIKLTYDKVSKQYHFKRGKVHFGKEKAVMSTGNGLQIEGSMPIFSLKAWKPVIAQFMAHDKNTGASTKKEDTLQSIQLTIPVVDLGGQTLHHATVLWHKPNTQWVLTIKSDEIAGDIQTISKDAVSANLAYMRLNSSSSNKLSSFQTLSPRDIPRLNLVINDFQYNKMHLGRMQLITEHDKKDNALIIKKLSLQSSATDFLLDGRWSVDNKTVVGGYLMSNNLQKTFSDWGMSPDVEAKKTRLSFRLNWPDAIMNMRHSILNGEMDLSMEDGVITHLNKSTEEKIGFGKILSLLSLQSLPKRLTLDFSDLSSKGFSFDTLKGSFVLKQGNMKTTDTYVDGPVAYVGMTGDINLGKKTYDLILKVAPHTTSSIPIIATIAGGPIVGLAAFAANTLIHQSIKYTYKVTGPWDHPDVNSVE